MIADVPEVATGRIERVALVVDLGLGAEAEAPKDWQGRTPMELLRRAPPVQKSWKPLGSPSSREADRP